MEISWSDHGQQTVFCWIFSFIFPFLFAKASFECIYRHRTIISLGGAPIKPGLKYFSGGYRHNPTRHFHHPLKTRTQNTLTTERYLFSCRNTSPNSNLIEPHRRSVSRTSPSRSARTLLCHLPHHEPHRPPPSPDSPGQILAAGNLPLPLFLLLTLLTSTGPHADPTTLQL